MAYANREHTADIDQANRERGNDVTEENVPDLSADEIEAQDGEALPDREAMSLVNANVAVPVNLAVAANVLSDDAVAYADATQDSVIDQSS